jgi:two-component system response regulator NreC
MMLRKCSSLECIGTSDLGGDALKHIELARPDVLLLEIDAHDRRTTHILTRLASSIPTTHIIAHSPNASKRFVIRLLRAGVQGYLSDADLDTELIRAISIVMQGDVFLCPTASGALVSEYLKSSRSRAQRFK